MLLRRSPSILTKALFTRAFCTSKNGIPSAFPIWEPETAPCKKIIKVAFIGIPNAGKSTLVNSLAGYNVCGVSHKTETTKEKRQVALTEDDTQIIFVDTPGLVSDVNIRRFKLDEKFVSDSLIAVEEAHIVGVIHDAANYFVKDYIDYKIIQILEKMPKHKKAFLVLNKIDKIKKKQYLLDTIRLLTSDRTNADSDIGSGTEKDLGPKGWTKFSRVFLISALDGDGIGEIVNYLKEEANTGHWEIPPDEVSNASPQKLIIDLIKAHFLDLIPYSIPRFTSFLVDHFEIGRLGEISCVVRVKCLNAKHKEIFIKWKSKDGRVLQVVAKKVEDDMSTILKVPVKIKVVVDSKTKDYKDKI